MIRPKNRARAEQLRAALTSFNAQTRALRGIQTVASFECLVAQILESIRRVEFVSAIQKRQLHPDRGNPDSELFDPVRAAALHLHAGNHDEACWLVFLFVHFGKGTRGGWRLVRDVYGALGQSRRWDWPAVSNDPGKFTNWLAGNESALHARRGTFGNHRKYETLNSTSPNGTAAVVSSYVEWIGPPRVHRLVFDRGFAESGENSKAAFDSLYRSMNAVRRFGRTAKFDYLTMLGKLGAAEIEPGVPYLREATGPLRGARLLFAGNAKAPLPVATLEDSLVALGASLDVGMQVIEDSLCNWQKSPEKFKAFRG